LDSDSFQSLTLTSYFYESIYRYSYESRGAKELISQGLLILERLTEDKVNCTEINKHQALLCMITSPLSSRGFRVPCLFAE